MKENWEEKRIEELFQEARREDERLTPSFANLLEADPSRTEFAYRFLMIRRFAVAIAVLLILSFGAAFLFLREPKSPQLTAEKREPVAEEIQQPTPATQPVADPKISEIQPVKRKEVRRRSSSRVSQSDILISRWKPPTDFLLRFPGEKFLKTTPDLVKPLEAMEPFVEEIQN